MASSTLPCENAPNFGTALGRVAALTLGLLALTVAVAAQAFAVRSADTTLHDRVYYLQARIDYVFSEDALEALHSGVPLVIQLDIEVLQERNWWPDETVAQLAQRYRLAYHALSEKYLVRNLNSDAQEAYPSLTGALAALGNIRALPLLDKDLLQPDRRYWGRLRVHLDIESLPAPMRPLAYISSQWRLSSNWYQWSVEP